MTDRSNPPGDEETRDRGQRPDAIRAVADFLSLQADPPNPMAETVELLPVLVQTTRKDRGLSLRDAAQQIDYSYADLCRFEHGQKQPTLPVIVRMLRWLAEPARLTDKEPQP